MEPLRCYVVQSLHHIIIELYLVTFNIFQRFPTEIIKTTSQNVHHQHENRLDDGTGQDLAREIRSRPPFQLSSFPTIPGDLQNRKHPAAVKAAFAKLLKDLRASDPPAPHS